MRTSIVTLIAGCALATTALASCSVPAQPTAASRQVDASSSTPVPAQPVATKVPVQRTLRVALPHRVLFDVVGAVYVGLEKGMFEQEGLKLDLTFTSGGAANLQGALTGEIDLVVGSGTPSVFQAFSKNAPLRIIGSEMNGTSDLFWYALKEATINGLRDLSGKKVAYSSQGASTHLAVLAMNDMLREQGAPGLEAVATGSPPDTFTAVKTRQIEVGWSTPPFLFENIDKGELKFVVRGDDITSLRDLSVRVYAVNSNFAEKDPEAIAAFVRVHTKALDFIYSNRNEAIAIWKARAQLSEPEGLLLKVLDLYPKEALVIGPVKGVDRLNKLAVDLGQLDRPLTKEQLDTLITTRFLYTR